MFLVRLVVGPVILVAYLIAAILMMVFAGLGWIAYGTASVSVTWPNMS